MRRRSFRPGSFGRRWLRQRPGRREYQGRRWQSQWRPAIKRKPLQFRPGMTLIEVLLALAVLAVAMGAVAQLVHIGTRAAESAEETATAQLVAESKMNELACGAAPIAATGLVDYEGREGWQYSVDVTPIEEPAGLVSVKVYVQQADEDQNGVSFELYRWMPSEGFLDMGLVDSASGTDSGMTDSGLSLPGSSPPSGSASGGLR